MNEAQTYGPTEDDIKDLPDPRYHQDPEGYIPERPGPVLRAATDTDLRRLNALLSDGRFWATSLIVGPLNGPWRSALTEAILARLPEHAQLLLHHGANVNGFPDWCFSAASSRFIRGRKPGLTHTGGEFLRSRNDTLRTIDASLSANQMAPITKEELDLRRGRRSRFWAEPDFPRTDYPTNNPISSISACAKTGATSLIQLLSERGADEAAWKTQYDSVPQNAGPSYLAVDPPLHVAVEAEDEDMLVYLLERGHKPDIFPLALVTRCRNALMLTLTKSPPWLRGFDILASSGSNVDLRTPIFGCHLLHLAIATLDIELLQYVLVTIGYTPQAMTNLVPTALGHTLLHIACLPASDQVVNLHSLPIYMSIHEFRTLDTTWEPLHLQSTSPALSGPGSRGRGRGGVFANRGRAYPREGGHNSNTARFDILPQQEWSRQKSMIKHLLHQMSDPETELSKQDIHGNTPLHYLASYRNVDESFLAELGVFPSQEDGHTEDVVDDAHSSIPENHLVQGGIAWNGIRNQWGFTPADLLRNGKAAMRDWEKDNMPFWREESRASSISIGL